MLKSSGWVCHVVRLEEQRRATDGKRRTVGRYQVYHDGVAQTGPGLSGTMAEAGGPGANAPAGSGRRIAAGRYALATQGGSKYVTWGYRPSLSPRVYPKPGIELLGTGERSEILIHPGIGFLASVGCLLPCTVLPDAREGIDYGPSRNRVIALIEDLQAYVGTRFPSGNGRQIPEAFVVLEGEPASAG